MTSFIILFIALFVGGSVFAFDKAAYHAISEIKCKKEAKNG